MKLPWDKKYICWGITGFVTISASVLFFMILQKWESFSALLSIIGASLRPITYGLILAYLLNPLLNLVENHMVRPLSKAIFKKNHKLSHNMSRSVSIFFTWVIALLCIFTLFAIILPELYATAETLIELVPQIGNNILLWANKFLKENPDVLSFLEKCISGFTTDLTDIMGRLQEWIPNLNTMIVGITSSVYEVFTTFLNIFVGIIVSIYILKDKEKFTAQFKRIFYSIMPINKANGTIAFFRLTHDKFGNFITGKIFDSIIIGILCFIILLIFNIPYAALVSVIVGVTNVIPFFGPFFGAIPSAILILFVDPIKCLTFIIIIFCLQQFDGNILGPKILGSTTGISSFWVIFAILVGSGMFGVWGMICAVPMIAVIFALGNQWTHSRMRKKGIDYSTETFQNIDHIDEKTNAPVWIDQE